MVFGWIFEPCFSFGYCRTGNNDKQWVLQDCPLTLFQLKLSLWRHVELPLLRFLRPSVPESDCAVENQLWQIGDGRWKLGIFVQCKVGETFELVAQLRLGVSQAWLAFGGHHFQ